MIIDLDSHLREEYFLDEVYKLDGAYARFTPVRVHDSAEDTGLDEHLHGESAYVTAKL